MRINVDGATFRGTKATCTIRAAVRVFRAGAGHAFHPDAYILHSEYAGTSAYIGSSNFTQHALRRGIGSNLRLDGLSDVSQLQAIGEEFERLLRHPQTTAMSATRAAGNRARLVVSEPVLG